MLSIEVCDKLDEDVDGVLKVVVGEVLMGVIDEKMVLYFDMVVVLYGWFCCLEMLFMCDCVGVNLVSELKLRVMFAEGSLTEDWVGV